MKSERNKSPQFETTIKTQYQHTQVDEVDEVYDFHTQMKVYDDDVHIQTQINQ